MNRNQKALEMGKKVKHGSISILLTVVVIAAVVIANVIFSAFAYKNNWYVDLTAEGIYGLTDAGREMLDDIEADIQIHFCAPYDELESNTAQKMVFELVKEMASEYDNITYDYLDPVKNPTSVIKYKNSAADSINSQTVIVESGSEFRVFALEALFVIDTDNTTVWAFNGEKKLITAMVQCTQAETPIAYFTYTHGESISTSMQELFYDAGYELRTIDLTTEEIHEDARLIVISNPLYDFEGISEATAGRKSEIEKIDDFLDGFGNLMVFMDPDTAELPELEEFLVEWGIEFDDSVLKDPSNSIDTNHYALSGQYSLEENSLGASLVSDIVSVGTAPKTIVNYASPINLLWDYNNNRQTSTAIYTSDKAQKYVDGKVVEEGQFPLVAFSRETRYIDNTPHYSYVFAIGSKYFTADTFLSPTYANSDIIYTMMRAMGKVQVPIDLKFKVFEDESLDILESEAGAWTWTLAIAIPACVFIAGIIIWIRRKHA
ncbi:MAG: Gldg family protein [Clostridia bacterium]|nr:Gldg family protein [Clostridia bacterium]